MPCKTRQAALRGERSKPHYHLPSPIARRFVVAGGICRHSRAVEAALLAFESRIDWSTWGASR